jgi:hypothetical protein
LKRILAYCSSNFDLDPGWDYAPVCIAHQIIESLGNVRKKGAFIQPGSCVSLPLPRSEKSNLGMSLTMEENKFNSRRN